MSPRGRVRAIPVALAHLYVVLTCLPLQEEASYLLPFPDCIQDLAASAALPSQVNLLYHIPSSLSRPTKNFFRFFFRSSSPMLSGRSIPQRCGRTYTTPSPPLSTPHHCNYRFFYVKKRLPSFHQATPFVHLLIEQDSLIF